MMGGEGGKGVSNLEPGTINAVDGEEEEEREKRLEGQTLLAFLLFFPRRPALSPLALSLRQRPLIIRNDACPLPRRFLIIIRDVFLAPGTQLKPSTISSSSFFEEREEKREV